MDQENRPPSGRVELGGRHQPQATSLSMDRDGSSSSFSFPSGANPVTSLSNSFKEAQRKLEVSAREHPKVRDMFSELDRMEATFKKGAREGIDSLRKLSSSGGEPGSSFMSPFNSSQGGMRRISSDTRLLCGSSSPTASMPRLDPVPIPENSLMKTISRTVQNAQKAAEENARSVSARFQGSVALPRMQLDDPGSTTDGSISSPSISVERIMARPLAVLQKAQQAVESSYSETHVQVYQLMADRVQPVTTRFVSAGTMLPSAPPAMDHDLAREAEAQQVIGRLLGSGSRAASMEQLEASTVSARTGSLDAAEAKDEGMLADWKKWLVAWELKAAQFTAAELAGEIDFLEKTGLAARRHSVAGDDKDGGPPSSASAPSLEDMADSGLSAGIKAADPASSKGPSGWRRRLPWNRAHHPREGSDLRVAGRKVAIVTTASLPWMTGTAVNPLLRAVFLAKDPGREVTLVVPWLSKTDQETIFPNKTTFETPEQQEEYVREWARKRTGVDANFKVKFYPGRYAAEKGSILPVGDLTQYIPDSEADVAVLEEPEHLNWFHHGRCWTDKFNHVVGIVHTNYLDYARREEGGDIKEKLLKTINSWVCQAHCHKVVKLSGAVQPLPKEHTEFVHGVSPSFLDVGVQKREAAPGAKERFANGFYFIGKVVWAKGYTELLERLEEHQSSTGSNLEVDVYGGGPDLEVVSQASANKGLNLQFHGPKDHLSNDIHEYKAFINPSTSDVVATTSAEALAMGKFVICCEHPSNKFFSQFRNCLVYRTPEEFSEKIRYAMENEPHPLTPEETHRLTWEAATERFLDIASLSVDERNPGILNKAFDKAAYVSHNALVGIEPLRAVAGAGVGTKNNPASIAEYEPPPRGGGMFDRKSTTTGAPVKA